MQRGEHKASQPPLKGNLGNKAFAPIRAANGDDIAHLKAKAGIGAFVRSIEQTIVSLRAAGVTRPEQVAISLNHLGIRTASRGKWTSRTAYFLLALIREGKLVMQDGTVVTRR